MPAFAGMTPGYGCYGTVPQAGLGLGFERTLADVTGLANVRDAIPFPRTPGKCQVLRSTSRLRNSWFVLVTKMWDSDAY